MGATASAPASPPPQRPRRVAAAAAAPVGRVAGHGAGATTAGGASSTAAPARGGADAAVTAKIDRALLPLFFAMTVLCYLDRTNLAYAALQLNERLGFSESTYAAGASIFFVSYASAQLPSNAALLRWGASRWLPALVVAWGAAAVAFAGMRTARHFLVLRVALGLAEAGVFPGMWYVLSRFYGPADLPLAYTRATLGTVLAQAAGAPLAAALLSLDGVAGLAGWQWLFVAEGVPTLVLGCVLARALPDGPADARFLTADDRALVLARTHHAARLSPGRLKGDLEKGAPAARATHAAQPGAAAPVAAGDPAPHASILAGVAAAAATPRTWHCAAVVALEAASKNAIIYWSPLIIAGLVTNGGAARTAAASAAAARFHTTVAEPGRAAPATSSSVRHLLAMAPSPTAAAAAAASAATAAAAPVIALLCAAPFGVAALAMWATAARAKHHSGAKHGAPSSLLRTHAALPYAVAAAALLAASATIAAAPAAAFAALLVAAAGVWAPSGVVYGLPASFLHGPAAAAGIALINSLGNVGGAVGPMLVGWLKARTGGHAAGLAALAASAAAAAATVSVFPVVGGAAGGAGAATVSLVASASTGSLRGGGGGGGGAAKRLSSDDEAGPPSPSAKAGTASSTARRRSWWRL